MKIALCSSFVPFIYGGARNIVEWLEVMLQEAGHQVEKIYLPHVDAPNLLFKQMASYRLIDLAASADRIICFRPPAHVIPHPHKILWFIHHMRAYYDLWDTPYRGFPDDTKHRGIRDALYATDTAALREAKHVFTNSQVVSDRLKHYNDFNSEVLYPPVFQPNRFHCRSFNDEIVYVCRVEHHKRQHILVEAMQYTRTPVKLRLSGAASNETYVNEILGLISKLKLDGKVIFENRWISEAEKISYLADCLGAAYLPLDEDSYGYPSIEASHASKPIITTTDSGGVLELVTHRENGFVTEPDPRALAEAMDELYIQRDLTLAMGLNAHARIDELNIHWPHVLERLLS